MFTKAVALAIALSTAASAAPALEVRQDDPCQDTYKACVAAGTAEVICSCDWTACLGEDNARNREWCASATANLPKPTSTGIPGGCNPAHPGSCPSSYFATTSTPVPSFTPIPGIPGGCNPAHPGSCPSSYFLTSTKSPTPSFTSIPGIPGGCNPAHPGSCPTPSSGAAAPVATAAPGSNPVLVPGKTWTIANLTRYCGEDNSGCDYNFAVEANGKTERCTVIRMPGSNAATESWADQKCTTGSGLTISWGYVKDPAPAFAVVTVVNGKELAWFGVADVNGGKVTPNSPFGSGNFGTLPASPVYTY